MFYSIIKNHISFFLILFVCGANIAAAQTTEVFQIEPLLTTRNSTDEIEGVKYAQITTVLVNAVNQQQTQIEEQNKHIEAQQKQIEKQQQLIDALRKLVCQSNPQAEVCQ
jgi:uncharacterized protein HemX